LKASAATHGHLCPGQVVGVRMAMLGCRLIGLDEPRQNNQIKKLLVYVEMDRCTADAVAHFTGVKLGRRSPKFIDYGIMAATFMNLDTADSYRVISTEEARDLVPMCPILRMHRRSPGATWDGCRAAIRITNPAFDRQASR
jgi:formylmethanofuran dehydrogenase subunit E